MPLSGKFILPLLIILAFTLPGCSKGREYLSLSEAERSALPDSEGISIIFANSPRELGYGGSCPLPSKVNGEANILVIPLEYDDQKFNPADYEALFNSIGGNPLSPSSAKEYFQVESKGLFVPNFVFARPINVSGISLPDKSQWERCSYLFEHELRAYMGTNEAPYPLKLFDADSDGLYDGVIFLETKKDNPFLGGCFEADGAGDSQCAVSSYAAVSPYYYRYDSSERTVSFIAHEMGHLLGLGDTYAGKSARHPMGGFSLMEATPGEIVPFEKTLLGWEEPKTVDKTSGAVSLKPGESVYCPCPSDAAFPLARALCFQCVDPAKDFLAYPDCHGVTKPGVLVTKIDARIGTDKKFLYSNKAIGVDEDAKPFMNLLCKTAGHCDDLVSQDVEAWHSLSDGDDAFFLSGDSFNEDGKATFSDGTPIDLSCTINAESGGMSLSFK
jgi:M6 family metalloprotease-like protein